MTPYLKPEIHFKTIICGIYVRFRGGGGKATSLFSDEDLFHLFVVHVFVDGQHLYYIGDSQLDKLC